MPIAAKPILAGTLLLGVTAVWVPRLTGFDPLGMLPEEAPVSTEIPSSGSDPTWRVADTDGSAVDGTSTDDDISIESLEQIVAFLEGEQGRVAPPVASTEPRLDTGSDDGLGAEAAFAKELNGFLGRHPLQAIIDGGGLTTATFGLRRVQVGDALMDERVHIAAIDLQGVVLATPEGRIRVHLPPSGARAYSSHSESMHSETDS